MKKRVRYDDWAKLLKKYGEESSNSFVKVVGRLPHPSESGYDKVIEDADH